MIGPIRFVWNTHANNLAGFHALDAAPDKVELVELVIADTAPMNVQ